MRNNKRDGIQICLEHNLVGGYFWYDLTDGYTGYEELLEAFKQDLMDKIEDRDIEVFEELKETDIDDIDFEITDVECVSGDWQGEADELIGHSLNALIKLNSIIENENMYGVKFELFEEHNGRLDYFNPNFLQQVEIIDFEDKSFKTEEQFVVDYIVEGLIESGNVSSTIPFLNTEKLLKDLNSYNEGIEEDQLEEILEGQPDLIRNRVDIDSFYKYLNASGDITDLSFVRVGTTSYLGRIID